MIAFFRMLYSPIFITAVAGPIGNLALMSLLKYITGVGRYILFPLQQYLSNMKM